MKLITYIRSLGRNDKGQDLLEYALLVALIAIVCIVGVTAAGGNINDLFSDIGEETFAPAAAQ